MDAHTHKERERERKRERDSHLCRCIVRLVPSNCCDTPTHTKQQQQQTPTVLADDHNVKNGNDDDATLGCAFRSITPHPNHHDKKKTSPKHTTRRDRRVKDTEAVVLPTRMTMAATSSASIFFEPKRSLLNHGMDPAKTTFGVQCTEW